MDVFKVKRFFASTMIVRILRPLLLLGLAIFVIMAEFLKLSKWGPLIIIGAILWAIYDVYKAYKVYSFEVEISDDSIRVENETRSWPEITHAKFKPGLGMDPYIILYSSDDKELNIPAALENVSYVATMVEKHVDKVDKQV